jgi:hypothetical protein
VWLRAARIWPRSTSSKVRSPDGAGLAGRAPWAGVSSISTPRPDGGTGTRSRSKRRIGPWDNTTARSTTFCSSRTFPGQG